MNNNPIITAILPKGLELSAQTIMADLNSRGYSLTDLSDDVKPNVWVAAKPVLTKGLQFVWTGESKQVFAKRNDTAYDYAALVCLDKDANVLLVPYSILQAWIPETFNDQDGRANNYNDAAKKAIADFYGSYGKLAVNSPTNGFTVDASIEERLDKVFVGKVLEVMDISVIKGYSEAKDVAIVNRLTALKHLSDTDAKKFIKACDTAYKAKASK